MNSLLGNQLKGFLVIVDCDVSPIDVSVNFSNPKTTERHLHSILAYLVSTCVKVLEANVLGLLSCSSAAPSPYPLASVCVLSGCDL